MTHDLTQGRLFPILVKFTIPLLIGNILQLTYNAVDSIIVGRHVGSVALAAVGTSNPMMTLIIMFVQGISIGAGILIGMLYGAHEYEKLRRQISTAMISGSVFSAVIALAVIACAEHLFRILKVDEVIIPSACLYLRIIACGLIFNFIYNFLASTLRALGDSRSPLYFLGISSVINVIGDLFFVLCLNGGIMGCAVSTVLSEALSCLLCWLYIKKKIPLLDMGKEWFIFEPAMLKKTLQYGFVSAIQQSTVQMGIVGVQGLVNSLGVTATAAFSAANRIDDYALIPGRNMANAMTSVMAQNMGAGKKKRVMDTFRIGILMELSFGLLAGILLLVVSRPVMGLFTGETPVIEEGMTYLKLIALMYFLPAFTNGMQGFFRGVGDLKVTLVGSILNMGMRFASCFYFIAVRHMGIEAVPWACLVGWICLSIYGIVCFALWYRKHKGDIKE